MAGKPAKVPAVNVLGSRVHLITAGQTVDQIERWIEDRNGGCRRVIVTGFHGLWEAHKDAELPGHPEQRGTLGARRNSARLGGLDPRTP